MSHSFTCCSRTIFVRAELFLAAVVTPVTEISPLFSVSFYGYPDVKQWGWKFKEWASFASNLDTPEYFCFTMTQSLYTEDVEMLLW